MSIVDASIWVFQDLKLIDYSMLRNYVGLCVVPVSYSYSTISPFSMYLAVEQH